MPSSGGADDEFASPKKSRVSLTTADIVSSASSEAEIDELTRLWQWEKQRADRTQEQLEFIEAECQLHFCPGAKSQSRKRRSTTLDSPRRERPSKIAIVDAADHVILGQKRESLRESLQARIVIEGEPVASSTPDPEAMVVKQETPEVEERRVASVPKKEPRRSTRRSTIFVPSEGIFRTISQQDLQERAKEDASITTTTLDEQQQQQQPAPIEEPTKAEPPHYARTPSVEPPSFAMIAKERESLLSLLNAPHESEPHNRIIANIPTTAGDDAPVDRAQHHRQHQPEEEEAADIEMETGADPSSNPPPPPPTELEGDEEMREIVVPGGGPPRPHTAASFYTVTRTTSVPIRDPTKQQQQRPHTIAVMPMSNSNGSSSSGSSTVPHSRTPSFDVTNPALTPTMTREQALAQIKERRSRSRSGIAAGTGTGTGAGAGAATPRRQMMVGVNSGAGAGAVGGSERARPRVRDSSCSSGSGSTRRVARSGSVAASAARSRT